jgi:voltage-gated potassium channel
MPTRRPSGAQLRIFQSPAAGRREIEHFLRRLVLLSVLLATLGLAGAGAFSVFEHESFWQGLMRTVDTITTIGSIPHAHRLGAQITDLVLITFGLGTLFYLAVTVTELFVAGELSGFLEERRMRQRIEQLSDHFLICGFGRVGHQVARDLLAADVPFVVVDENPEVQEDIAEMNLLYVDGPASDDETLCEAGIRRARGVIACVDSDAENIFITLTARGLRPDIEIVARASEEGSETKLLRAGANAIISPYKASGRAMARLALGSRSLPPAERETVSEHSPLASP